MMTAAYPKKVPIKPKVQMRQLHWGKLADAKVKGTMWDGEVDDGRVTLDIDELEGMFAAVAAKREGDVEGRVRSETKGPKKPEVVTLVDPKTANNTAIALSRFRLPPEEIATSLLTGAKLPADMISSLMAILPTSEDAELVTSYDGPKEQLGKAEQFFLAIAAVPRYTMRTKCLQVRATFAERVEELELKLQDVSAAVQEVRSSKALKSIFEHALAVGNYLNGGTSKGAAWGFKVDSLNKLIGTKTLDGKSTLLHYLARKLATRGLVEQLLADFTHLRGAASIIWKDEIGELAAITASVAQVATQVKLDKNEEFKSSMGAFHSSAHEKVVVMTAMKDEADGACKEMLKWLGEDAKAQPEEAFSALHNFSLSLEKGHRYNLECDEKAAKQARQEEAARKRQEEMRSGRDRTISDQSASSSIKSRAPPPLGVGMPPPSGVAVDSELAAKLARRNQGANTGLVDNVQKGMANGIPVRQLSFTRKKAPPKASNWQPQENPRISTVSADL